jgi:predicted solute-binding protein
LSINAGFDKIILKMIVRKRSLHEAEEADLEEWRSMTPEERLDLVQYLREIYYEFKNEDRKRFQRVYRIVKQK